MFNIVFLFGFRLQHMGGFVCLGSRVASCNSRIQESTSNLLGSNIGKSIPIGSIVVPVCGSYLGSYKDIPSRNYHGAYGTIEQHKSQMQSRSQDFPGKRA